MIKTSLSFTPVQRIIKDKPYQCEIEKIKSVSKAEFKTLIIKPYENDTRMVEQSIYTTYMVKFHLEWIFTMPYAKNSSGPILLITCKDPRQRSLFQSLWEHEKSW